MSSQTIKAIQNSHKEQKLLEINRKIKKYTGVINSTKVKRRFKREAEDKMVKLLAQKKKLEQEITEDMFLNDDY